MGVYAILPESVLTIEVNVPTIAMDGEPLPEIVSLPPRTNFAQQQEDEDDELSIADSVNLLMEQHPKLFHPKEEEDDEEEDDIVANYFSLTEYELPLKDNETARTKTKTVGPRRNRRTRRRRLEMRDSFGCLENDDEASSASSDVDSIEFPTCRASEPVPPTVVVVPNTTTTTTCNF